MQVNKYILHTSKTYNNFLSLYYSMHVYVLIFIVAV